MAEMNLIRSAALALASFLLRAHWKILFAESCRILGEIAEQLAHFRVAEQFAWN